MGCLDLHIIVVQDNVRRLFDAYEEYAFERFGGRCVQRPQLPLIPLAVDLLEVSSDVSADFASALTAKIQIEFDDIVVLWVGRLSFFEKTFPQSTFLALKKAVSETSKNLHFLPVGLFLWGDDDFVQCSVEPDQWLFVWDQLQDVNLNSVYPGFRLNQQELMLLRSHLHRKPCCSVRELKNLFLPSRSEHVLLTLSWLCKYGLLSIPS
ncbi:hypothetical protein [Synechococcus sp. UW179A]|uniref:hypothetical protein n=1 Tax=Synechococcus sp. UW179A TaxID=2575510 RepID=UPI000E0FE842|nr:hypothetical protein [Synechococcus sp. UW179A]